MSRILAILGIMGAVALGSCVGGTAPNTDGLAWSYQNSEGEGPKLAYGAPMSDHVVLMMTCNPGAPTTTVSLLGGSPQGGLALASGRDRTALSGQPIPSPSTGHLIEADAELASPALARFARTGDLTLIDRGRSVDIDAKGGERQDVARFFQACQA
jgi:hypothetical protein